METRINQDEIIIGKYKTATPNPSVASTYPRNSNGTVVVDANVSDTERRKLVVNLVGTRYSNTSFTEVLDTAFEEFLDPEIKVPDLETAQQADNSASKILELQAQLESEKLKNNSNQAIIDQLQGAITNAQQLAISSIADEFPTADDKKARIFSDNTLIRERNRPDFFYIVEAGKKRRFITDNKNELVGLVAKAIGKVKEIKDNGDIIVDFIEVSQEVLDDIPSGAPFVNFDLVKDVNTPALPSLTLPDGAQIVAKWVNSAPVTLQVTSDQLNNLTIDLDLQMTTAIGSINYLYILDLPINQNGNDVSDWFPGRLALVASSVDATEPNSIRKFTIPLKRTAWDINVPFGANTPLQPLNLNATTPEITIPITAKLFNDNDGQGFSDTKYVTVKLASKVPSLSNKTISAARTELAANGLQLNVSSYTYTSQRSLDDKIITQDVPVNTALTPGSVINVTAHQYGRIVPDVSGKKLSQALSTLRSNSLNMKSEYNGPSATQAVIIGANFAGRNQINSQSPAAGSIVDDNTEITVYYTIY